MKKLGILLVLIVSAGILQAQVAELSELIIDDWPDTRTAAERVLENGFHMQWPEAWNEQEVSEMPWSRKNNPDWEKRFHFLSSTPGADYEIPRPQRGFFCLFEDDIARRLPFAIDFGTD